MTRTFLRRTLIGAAGVVGVGMIAAAIFVATFDVNRYKPQIAAAVKERTGRTLAFDGELSLSLFPRIAVQLPATTLSEPGRDTVFARLQSAQASLALMPLLERRFEVDGLRIDGLQATIVRQKDGRTNVDDLMTPKAGAPAGTAAPSTPSGAATVGAVTLKNADLTWRDLATGRTVRLSGLDLRAGRYAAGARMPVDASATIDASAPAFAGKARVEAAIDWNDDGGVRALRDLVLTAEGTLDRRPLTVDTRAGELALGPDSFDVRALKVRATGRSESGAPLELQLAAPRIEANRERAAGDRVEVTLVRQGPEPLDTKVLVEGLRGTASRLEAPTVKIAGQSRSAQRTTRFDVTTALVASVNDRTASVERASGEVTIEDPAFGPKPVRLPVSASGTIDGRREAVRLQFQTRGEGLSARGRIDATGFAAPRVAFDIEADEIDADRYLLLSAPARDAGPAKGPAPAAAAAAADAKVDFSALRDLNVAGNLRVARLRAKGTDLADVRAAVKAGEGRLEVAPFSAKLHGGSVNGRLGLDARGSRAAASGSLSGVQLRPLLGNLGGRAALEGTANGTFDLAAAGTTVQQMKRALGGALALEVRDGALVGIDLADVIGTASGFLQSRGRQTGALDEKRRTPFSQLSASVRIKDGIATNDDLKAKSPQLEVTGRGRMDVVSTELDYRLAAQVATGPAVENSPLRPLAGMTVPVAISGPIDRPNYTVDWAPIAAELLLRRATGRSGAPAVNQVIEGLGELLRRKK